MLQYTNRAYYISPSGRLVTQIFTYTIKSSSDVLLKVALRQDIS